MASLASKALSGAIAPQAIPAELARILRAPRDWGGAGLTPVSVAAAGEGEGPISRSAGAAGDIDGDGYSDVLVHEMLGYRTTITASRGFDGTELWSFSSEMFTFLVDSTDLNADGKRDLLFFELGEGTSVPGQVTGFEPQYEFPFRIRVLDAQSGRQISSREMTAKAIPGLVVEMPSDPTVTADADGDGDPEIFVATLSLAGGVVEGERVGAARVTGSFLDPSTLDTVATQTVTGDAGVVVRPVADIDGDGRADTIVREGASDAATVNARSADGTAEYWSAPLRHGEVFYAWDVTADGVHDVVAIDVSRGFRMLDGATGLERWSRGLAPNAVWCFPAIAGRIDADPGEDFITHCLDDTRFVILVAVSSFDASALWGPIDVILVPTGSQGGATFGWCCFDVTGDGAKDALFFAMFYECDVECYDTEGRTIVIDGKTGTVAWDARDRSRADGIEVPEPLIGLNGSIGDVTGDGKLDWYSLPHTSSNGMNDHVVTFYDGVTHAKTWTIPVSLAEETQSWIYVNAGDFTPASPGGEVVLNLATFDGLTDSHFQVHSRGGLLWSR